MNGDPYRANTTMRFDDVDKIDTLREIHDLLTNRPAKPNEVGIAMSFLLLTYTDSKALRAGSGLEILCLLTMILNVVYYVFATIRWRRWKKRRGLAVEALEAFRATTSSKPKPAERGT